MANVSQSEVEHHQSKDIPDVIKEGKKTLRKNNCKKIAKTINNLTESWNLHQRYLL